MTKIGSAMNGRAARAGDHVGGRRHLADVEFDVADHAAERPDDRHHLDEIRIDALDRRRAVFTARVWP